jgi:hypothetical protein
MNISILKSFLLWCTIINAGLLMLTFLMFAFAGNLIYRVHTIWFPMSKETFSVVLYSFLGLYKIFFIMFNLVPYVALVIAG